jgi:FtsH-binding integral membrane protein
MNAPAYVDALFPAAELSDERASMVKKGYLWFIASMGFSSAGGYLGACTEAWVLLFSGSTGWVLAAALFLVIPRIGAACRNHPVKGAFALTFNGLLYGFLMAPIALKVSRHLPELIPHATAVTALVFFSVTAFVFIRGKRFAVSSGLAYGLGISIPGALLLNLALGFGWITFALALLTGTLGVVLLVTATSDLLHDPKIDNPIHAALALFAATFNIVASIVHLALRVSSRARAAA